MRPKIKKRPERKQEELAEGRSQHPPKRKLATKKPKSPSGEFQEG